MRKESFAIITFLLLCSSITLKGQMRQVHLESDPNNHINKISLYSPSQGYIGFTNWLGFTIDTGRTFTPKYITAGNVNYNGYFFSTIYGFNIHGVKAFSQNSIIAYGDYGLVPSILSSSDGGNTFILSYYSQFNSQELRTGIMDMVFPENNATGYAVDADRILKTNDQGNNWFVVNVDPARYYNYLEAIDNNNVFALSTAYQTNQLLKTSNGGSSWQILPLPTALSALGKMTYACFISPAIGWVSMYGGDNNGYIFKTIDGGNNWVLKNNVSATSYSCDKMKFLDQNTGFAISYQNVVFKTSNSGILWEPVARDNAYSYLDYSHVDLQLVSSSELLAGGGHGFLELNSNAGAAPLPKAYFQLDTTGLSATSIVNLTNFSNPAYQFKWYKNNVLISTAYNYSYTHAINQLVDTIKLVAINGTITDTAVKTQYFNVPSPPIPVINSFTPNFGNLGSVISIAGNNFGGASSVTFGGTPASSFIVNSNTSISAVLGIGSSGSIAVTTPYGTASKAGFSSTTPTITSFTPSSGGSNSVIAISGTNFTQPNLSIKFGGIAALTIAIQNDNLVNATVGSGASGNVTVQTNAGIANLVGFTFLPPPAIAGCTPLSANQGGTVTISGTGLNGATAIKFGGIPAASFQVVSPTSITAVVANGASGYITVITPRGSDSLAGFIYTSPNITSFSPSVGGAGTTVEIKGVNFTGITGVTFGGSSAASFTFNSPQSISAVIGSGSSGAVTLNSTNGTSSKPGFLYTSTPLISSFSPLAGPIGTVVYINGANFNAVPSSNIVYFGAARAVITSASANLLRVIMPAGGTYNPITVTTGGLTASSALRFLTTFPGGPLTSSSFSTILNYYSGGNKSSMSVGDFDNDGKPDLVVKNGDTVSIFKNISNPGTMAFAPRLDFIVPSGFISSSVTMPIGDVDGDGKLDIVCVTLTGFGVLRNTSANGVISFSPAINFTYTTTNQYKAALGDLDGDGKPDLVIIDNNHPYYFKNISTPGNISFGPKVIIQPMETHVPNSVAINDIDGDGRADIIISNSYNSNYSGSQNSACTVYKNISSINNIAFLPSINYGAAGTYTDVNLADMDGDSKPDVTLSITGLYASGSFYTGTNIGVYKNQSVPDSVVLNGSYNSTSGSYPQLLTAGSLNGDSKPDVIVSGLFSSPILEENISAGTGISFSKSILTSNYISQIVIADLDGDGKPDIAGTSTTSPYFLIFKNKTGDPVSMCPGGSTSVTSNITSFNYQWQQSTDSVNFVNINNNANFSGTNTVTLQLNNIPSSWYGYRYRCIVGGTNSDVFKITFSDTWLGSTNSSWEDPTNWSCGMVPDNNTDAIIFNGNAILNSNTTIRSLKLYLPGSLTVGSGFNLTVSH